MSPEQATGRAADTRSDIRAFGCVLFEMLTGCRAFASERRLRHAGSRPLRDEPDWTALPARVPPAIRTLVQRCLATDRQRFLMIKPGGGSDPAALPALVVVQHFDEKLKRLAPVH